MKYQFNRSKVSPLSDKRIMIPCLHISNQGGGEFHQH